MTVADFVYDRTEELSGFGRGREKEDPPEISPTDAAAKAKNGSTVIVDVRSASDGLVVPEAAVPHRARD